jgi:hypothetical protein
MPEYRVFRLKENLRQQFRWAPHLSGVTVVKPKDYEEAFTIEADSPYAGWHALRGTDQELEIGDVLSIDGVELRILKYIGFEEAKWLLPEVKSPEALEVRPAEAQVNPVG